MKIVIEKQKVKNQDISFFINEAKVDWPLREGEHYKLLTYLTKIVENETIIDAGTYQGMSCLCLAQNKNNNVFTYDIFSVNIPFLSSYKNVSIMTRDINLESEEFIHSSNIIVLDIDPHDGIQEKVFTDKLERIGYEGFVICDDIYLNPGMKAWWDSINEKKYDVTDIGHVSGTGIICYGSSHLEIV